METKKSISDPQQGATRKLPLATGHGRYGLPLGLNSERWNSNHHVSVWVSQHEIMKKLQDLAEVSRAARSFRYENWNVSDILLNAPSPLHHA